jgi:hypothetical protein
MSHILSFIIGYLAALDNDTNIDAIIKLIKIVENNEDVPIKHLIMLNLKTVASMIGNRMSHDSISESLKEIINSLKVTENAFEKENSIKTEK